MATFSGLSPRLLVAFLVFLASTSQALDNRGGAVSSNAGDLEFTYDPSQSCEKTTVFVISGADGDCGSLVIKLHALNPNAVLRVYEGHQLRDEYTCGTWIPSSSVGQSIHVNSSMATLILYQEEYNPEHPKFALSWQCAAQAPNVIPAILDAAFVSTESGMLSWNELHSKQVHTTAIMGGNNTLCVRVDSDFGPSTTMDNCDSSRLTLYEVQEMGCLARIHDVCGRKTSFKAENVRPKILAVAKFDHTLALKSSNSYQVYWNEGECPVDDACTSPPTTTEPSVPDMIFSNTCGGQMYLQEGTTAKIAYKNDTNYGNDERCDWVFDSETGWVDIIFDSYVFEAYFDGITIGCVDKLRSAFSCRQLSGSEYSQPQRVQTPCIVHFTSDYSINKQGFEFRAIPVASPNQFPYNVDISHSSAANGYLRYPRNANNYTNLARGLSVVQPAPGLPVRDFSYGTIDMEYPHDFIELWAMKQYVDYEFCQNLGAVSGQYSAGTFAPISTAHTVVSFVSTDREVTGTGYSMYWNAAQGREQHAEEQRDPSLAEKKQQGVEISSHSQR